MPDPFVHVDGSLDGHAVDDEVALADGDDHHVRNVLRVGVGDPLVVGDGRGRFAPAVVAAAGRVRLTAPVRTAVEQRPRLHVVQALPKGRKADEVVRALTELGVERVTLVRSERAVVQVNGPKAERLAQRWQAIGRSAAGQSRRPWLPEIAGPCDLDEVLPTVDRGLVPHVGADTSLPETVAGIDRDGEWTVAIGPEGGWSADEVERFVTVGLRPVSLGPSVLRTEHAGLVAVAAVGALTGRLAPPRGPWPPPAVAFG